MPNLALQMTNLPFKFVKCGRIGRDALNGKCVA